MRVFNFRKPVIAMAVIVAAVCLTGAKTNDVPNGTISHYSVRVDGLACPFCAYGLEKKIKNLEQTTNIKIDLDKGLLTFDIEGKRLVLPEQVNISVRDAGFTPSTMSLAAEGAVYKSQDQYLLKLNKMHKLILSPAKNKKIYSKMKKYVSQGKTNLEVSGILTKKKDQLVLSIDKVGPREKIRHER